MREFGIGDMGVPRRVKRAAAAVYERSAAYSAAQQGEMDNLAQVLVEHIFFNDCGDARLAEQLAAYVRRTAIELEAVPSANLLDGDLVVLPSVDFRA
jgi:cytochrome b pre-mRNA-processing protein 3